MHRAGPIELDFGAPSTSPHRPYICRKNNKIHHFGYRSGAANDNIIGFYCRGCSVGA